MTKTLRNLDALLSEAFVLFRDHFLIFFNTTAIAYFPIKVASVFLNKTIYAPDLRLLAYLVEKHVKGGDLYIRISFVYFAFSLLLIFLFFLSANILCVSLFRQEPLSSLGAYRKAWRMMEQEMKITAIYACKVALWSVLVIPGIYFSTLYSFASLAYISDGKRGQEALVFSRQLIRPHLRRYWGYSLIFFILFVLLFFLFDLILAHTFGVNEPGETRLFPEAGEMIFELAVLNLVGFSAVFYNVFYQELKKSVIPEPTSPSIV